jgi:hypothetical protein
MAQCGFVVGTSGTAARLRIRRTDTSGATEADTDAVAVTAAAKVNLAALGVDALGASVSQVYVATLTVTNGAAASTVGFVALVAFVI